MNILRSEFSEIIFSDECSESLLSKHDYKNYLREKVKSCESEEFKKLLQRTSIEYINDITLSCLKDKELNKITSLFFLQIENIESSKSHTEYSCAKEKLYQIISVIPLLILKKLLNQIIEVSKNSENLTQCELFYFWLKSCCKENPFLKEIFPLAKNFLKAHRTLEDHLFINLKKSFVGQRENYTEIFFNINVINQINRCIFEKNLAFNFSVSSDCGLLGKKNSDTYFYYDLEKISFVALFEGQGGSSAAKWVRNFMSKEVIKIGEDFIKKEDIIGFIKSFFSFVRKKFLDKKNTNPRDTTILFSFINKIDFTVYSANLGNSKAILYRQMQFNTSDFTIPIALTKPRNISLLSQKSDKAFNNMYRNSLKKENSLSVDEGDNFFDGEAIEIPVKSLLKSRGIKKINHGFSRSSLRFSNDETYYNPKVSKIALTKNDKFLLWLTSGMQNIPGERILEMVCTCHPTIPLATLLIENAVIDYEAKKSVTAIAVKIRA